ncbi:MAG: signal peptide peptidase SppA [Eggerthellaceae bacterium]|jgi:protease-4
MPNEPNQNNEVGFAPTPPQGAYAASPYGSPEYPVQPASPVMEPKKGKGWIVGLVAVILAFVLILFGIFSCSSASSSSGLGLIEGDTIGVITIDGTIGYDGSTSSPEGLKEQLDVAAQDDRIKAVVLRVNSGGGTAAAGEEMSIYLRDFSKPVVVSSAAINASAAYEISSQADYIYVQKSSDVGAIGTALQVTDLSELLDKLGISVDNITSSNSKDSTYGTRALTKSERDHYQKMVDQINDNFIDTVAEGRHLNRETVEDLATGLTYTGTDAVDYGLADAIGTKEDALNKAAELAGISSYQVVDLEPQGSELESLLGDYLGNSNSVKLDDFLKELEKDGSLSQ